MARTIDEIKSTMTADYVSHDTIKTAYELDENKTFEEQFSKVSLESIFFYITAKAVWVLEKLFDTHAAHMETLLDTKKPHNPKWYRDMTLLFQYGRALIADTDKYENTGVADNQIAAERVVKYAAAIEVGSELLIKVAGEAGNERAKLPTAQETALNAYLQDIRDAGVRLRIVNRDADRFFAKISVYYDPMILDENGNSLAGGGEPVRDAIRRYIANLPFNGEYSNMSLVDNVQTVSGVVIAELKESKYMYGNHVNPLPIHDKVTPDSGYFKIYNNADVEIEYIPYG